jgi:HSP20 family protein
VKKENYHRIERYFGAFQRSFSLPATVDQENVVAVCEKGVLTITLPKKEETKPKQINIAVKQI